MSSGLLEPILSEETTEGHTWSESLKSQFAQASFKDALKTVRDKSFARFLEKGLPERKPGSHRGAFQYVPLRQLYSESYTCAGRPSVSEMDILPHIYSECLQSRLVFVDGYFDETLSNLTALPKQVVALTLSDAMRSYGNFLHTRFARQEDDCFALLNLALHPQGAFVFIPPGMRLETPLQVLYFSTNSNYAFIQPRFHLLVGAHSEVQLISKSVSCSEQEAVWSSGVCDVSIEEGARVEHVDLVQCNDKTWHFDALRASVKKRGYLKSLSVTRGSKTVRRSVHAALIGEEAEALLQGVWKLSGFAQAHAHVTMQHEAPHTKSMQTFKGVLGDASQSSFEGKIYVTKAAQKTEAYQLNHNLLLGERAIAQSKPNLEIFADDVKASHGATIAQLDPQPLLYLRTRGIDEEQAKQLLVSGFYKELIDDISCGCVKEEAHAFIK